MRNLREFIYEVGESLLSFPKYTAKSVEVRPNNKLLIFAKRILLIGLLILDRLCLFPVIN